MNLISRQQVLEAFRQAAAGFLIWATGEFQFPDLAPFPGAQWCPHYARVEDWRTCKARRYTVIGGDESGVDAAFNLVKLGRKVRLLARKSTWDPAAPHDPSPNIAVILERHTAFGWVLLGVFLFFVATFLLGEAVSRLGGLGYPEHALLTMNIAARNAPLMLAVTMAALPGQPLVYAALVIGMLVEFPHLTVLQRVLLSQRQRAALSLQPSIGHS